MRSWNRWVVASLVPLVCFAVLLMTALPGQETGRSPATKVEAAEQPAAGAGLEMGTGAGLGGTMGRQG